MIAQQPPPPGGYTIELFERYLNDMGSRVESMRKTMDARAVFEITYLVFSRQVLAALKARRFEDMAWATDMACRFVEVYQEQLGLWNRRDPSLCRSWRIAFEAMEEGRVNVLQSMLLGINAHINYDLAFVTLGSSRHLGDLAEDDSASERALSGSRTGIPLVRYRDFLVINQLEWEAITLIQDTVLQEYNRALYWLNRASLRFTRFLGQRILMEARDQSWYQTTLLIHARPEERALLARAIDASAASMADLIGALSYRPDLAFENAIGWTRRWDRIDPELQAGMVNLACRNPVIADLVLRELAFAGAEPISIVETLLSRGEARLAGMFGRLALRRTTPGRRRQRFQNYLESGAPSAMAVLQAMVDAGLPRSEFPRSSPIETVRRNWTESLRDNLAHVSRVNDDPRLCEAIGAHTDSLRARLEPLGGPLRGLGPAPTYSLAEAKEFFAQHPDRWVRICAQAKDGDAMASLIETVLFLKESPVFMEVDIAVLLHVAEKLEKKTFLASDTLVESGKRSGGLFLIAKGQVEVAQRRDGGNVRIALLGVHDSIGELSALNDTPATANCTALTPVECYFLPSSVLSHLLHQHPRLSIGLIRMLSQRLMSTTLRISHTPPSPVANAPAAATLS